ncbi:MAG: hypothetical protein ABIK65_02305 [Candidatus Eisenbacteria bacterium]
MPGMPWTWYRRRLSRPSSVALFLIIAAAPHSTSGDGDGPPTPDGVCYPVNGTGYIITYTDEMAKEGLKIPIGTLSPLVEGDSLIVEAGTITFLDFRNGQSSIFGKGTRLKIPSVIDPAQPSWWERLEDQVVRGLTEPERKRLGGSVRRGQAAFWPDGGRFAPDVPIVFEWWRVRPAPATLRIEAGGEVTDLKVMQEKPGSGAFAWQSAGPALSGTVSWSLIDGDGDPLGGGEFAILTAQEAEGERQRFHDAAEAIGVMPPDLAAAVLAAADRAYLW